MKRSLVVSIIAIGATSMISQIVLMRELLAVFYGNELSIGVTLGFWLLWVSFGSWVAGSRIVPRVGNDTARLAGIFTVCMALSAYCMIVCVYATRAIPAVFGLLPGEIAGIVPMVAAAFVIPAPLCVLSGILFVIGCQMNASGSSDAGSIGTIYLMEAVGAAIGGIVASFVLIRLFSPFVIMIAAGLCDLAAAYFFARNNKMLALAIAVLGIPLAVTLCTGAAGTLEAQSLRLQWKWRDPVASEHSVYGTVTVTKEDDSYSVYTNGLLDFTVPDKETAEFAAHISLLEHPDPKTVLLIGGGSGDLLGEVLRHPVTAVDYVELDPLVIDLVRRCMPRSSALADRRVRVITGMDGRLFIKNARTAYDVVIISLPEPHTAQINRFFTEEFYREVLGVLTDDGILSFSLYSNPNYISQEQALLFRTLENTLKRVFQEVIITPGQVNYFVAARRNGALTKDWNVLMEKMRERAIPAVYMREYYLSSDFSAERFRALEERIDETPTDAINTDFRPIAYYYDMVLWSSHFRNNFRRLFASLNERTLYISMCVVIGAFIAFGMAPNIRKRFPAAPVLLCIGATGFAGMSLQIITAIAFQVMYGYVFYKLGLILTSFMAGLIAGSWVITRMMRTQRIDGRLFAVAQGIIALYSLTLPVFFWVFSRLKAPAAAWFGGSVLFPLLPVIPGLIGGFQFPLANSLYLDSTHADAGRAAALTYCVDLFGSFLGALLVTVFLIPIIGIFRTCVFIACLNTAGYILLPKARIA